jgi:hypothetical protein
MLFSTILDLLSAAAQVPTGKKRYVRPSNVHMSPPIAQFALMGYLLIITTANWEVPFVHTRHPVYIVNCQVGACRC